MQILVKNEKVVRPAERKGFRCGNVLTGSGAWRLSILFFAVCSMLFSLSGCGPRYYVKEKADIGLIRSIAVLPFENFTQDEHAGEKMRRIVISVLLSHERNVVEPGEVTRTLREMQVRYLGALKVAEIQDIGKSLGADAVMMGSVESFGISRGISVNYPEVTINLRLIETYSGEILWSIRHTSGGPGFWMRHFGSEGRTLSEAARKTVEEAVDRLF